MTDTVHQRMPSRLGPNLAAAEFRVRYLRGNVTTESLRERYQRQFDISHTGTRSRELTRVAKSIKATSPATHLRVLTVMLLGTLVFYAFAFGFVNDAAEDIDTAVTRMLVLAAIGVWLWFGMRTYLAPELAIRSAHAADRRLTELENPPHTLIVGPTGIGRKRADGLGAGRRQA